MIPGPVCYWNLSVIVIVRIVPGFRLAGWDLGRKNFPPDAAGIFSRCLRRLLTITLQYRNPIESSKLEATAAGSVAFILASLQRST
ncbi:hypothetical protein TNCV_3118041 [Trichonephila clavipes]|uniref:Uncharacterized protein n=1 Tax=Trichonephila clavipes TaxID=2585209 RepID=A0A8X6W9U9_TRICX|nr:hypothetical protein TNCV_3118041 [Trichonephila clavipes]